MKMFIQTVLGIVALLAGISLLYFFISELSTGFNFIFLILSVIFIGAGGFLFFRVSKIENTIPDNANSLQPVSAEGGSKLLEKNNKMVQDWAKTNSRKESLKAIEMAAAAQAQAAKEQGS
jgi:hypothetical protein